MSTTVPKDVHPLSPDLGEFRAAIDWLMRVGGVASTRLAGLFGTSAENVRRLKYFASRQIDPSLITFAPRLDDVPSSAIHRGVGIRSHHDILAHSGQPSSSTEELRHQIDTISVEHQQQYQFLAGAKRLARLKQKLGHMAESHRLSVAGRLEQKIAWFLVHSGFSRSAVSHASVSLWLLQAAYYRSRKKTDIVREFVKTALIASQANLLAGRPQASLQVLEIMRAAEDSINATTGSDYYRQRGVALFQLGSHYDAEARSVFERSQEQMQQLGEGNEAQALMTGARHIALLVRPDWERSLRVLESVEAVFPEISMERSMARHWAAACAFLTTDDRIRSQAQGLLDSNRLTAARFGHQATVSKLLSITPALGLSKGLTAVWLRKALYQNAFRFR